MGAIFGWVSLVYNILSMLPTIWKTIQSIQTSIDQHTQDTTIQDKLKKVDQGYATGDTRPIEEAMGQTPGLPSQHRDGVRVRSEHPDET